MGVDGQRHTLTALPLENRPMSIVQEARWTPGPALYNKANKKFVLNQETLLCDHKLHLCCIGGRTCVFKSRIC
jgi:hypothetical protein